MEINVSCLRCNSKMQFLNEYRFDSEDNNRGFLGNLFDVEDHLIFQIYVCPSCRYTEFFYTGSISGLD